MVDILSIPLATKYVGKSHELLTILVRQIECDAYFSSPKRLHLQAF